MEFATSCFKEFSDQASLYSLVTQYHYYQNYGATVGTIPVREAHFNPKYVTEFHGDTVYDGMAAPGACSMSMKWSVAVGDPEDFKKMAEMLDGGLKEGAIGIGHCPGYMTTGCTQQESVIAQKLAGKYGVSTFLHGRFSSQKPPTSGLLGIQEMMAPQAIYGGGICVHHIPAQTLAQTPQALEIIDDARAKGFRIVGEVYPYNYGATVAGADYLQPANYQNCMCRSYQDIIEVPNMTRLTKHKYEQLLNTAPQTEVLFYNATDETVNKALAHPSTVLGSDSFPYTIIETGKAAIDFDVPFEAVNGHPRGAGSHAKLLRLVREKVVDIPVMLAISKMTYMIAQYLEANGIGSMSQKGRMQTGMDADIILVDLEKVTDHATMQAGGLPSTGMPYVLVNGTVVVEDSEVLKGVQRNI
jgi:hypothetical protein